MKKLCIFLGSLALFTSPLWAQDQSDSQKLWVRTNASVEVIEASSVNEIVLPAAGGIQLCLADGNQINVAPEAFRALIFHEPAKEDPTGVQEVKTGDNLRLKGDVLSGNKSIVVVDMAGQLVLKSAENTLNVGTLSPGVYVAIMGDKTLKFTVR